MSDAPKVTRRLIVTSSKPLRSGVSDKTKKEWTLYALEATDENGNPLAVTLKSFRDCPIGVLTEYEVETQHHEQYGTSYLITPPKVDARAKLAELEGRIVALERALQGSSVAFHPAPAVAPPAAPAWQQPSTVAANTPAPDPNAPPVF